MSREEQTTARGLVAATLDAASQLWKEGPANMLARLSDVIRAGCSAEAYARLRRNFEDLASKGRVDSDFFKKEHGQACLAELLDDFDSENPDPLRTRTMQRVFLALADLNCDMPEERARYLLRRSRSIAADQLVLLLTAWKERNREHLEGGRSSYGEWIHHAAKVTCIGFPDDVIRLDKQLIELGFFTGNKKEAPGRSRLGDVGVALCEIIERGAELEAMAEE